MQPRTHHPLIAAVVALLAFAAGKAFADATFFDGTFSPADWSATIVSTDGATHSVSQSTTGGNPGEYRFMQHVLPSGRSIGVVHQYLAGVYDPSTSGAIDALDYREDRIEFNPPFPGAAIGAGAT